MSARLNPGQVLEGKYTILRQIGGGGMGIVYEAEHIELNVRVAVKVLHPAEADDPNVLARFKAEARSAAGIRHRNVVDVTDFGLTPERRPFFVMEYLTGESLADRLDERGSLSEREAVEIADQILTGLIAAHKKGIIHRDLKPENVWLSRDEGGAEVVKILDFGIAKIVGGSLPSGRIETLDLDDRPLTQRGIVLGTPGYMAPESLTFGGTVDARSDLFAVGVLLYEMILGRRPFNGVTVHEIMMATATAPVPQPRAIQPGVSAAMERLILTSLAKDADDRFQSAEEFLRHLTAAAVGRVPDHPRACVTAVGMPSVMPAAALKRVKHAVPESEPSQARRFDDPAYDRPFQEPWSGRRRERVRPPPKRKKKIGFRISSPISPLGLLFLAGIAVAFYFAYLHDGPWREIAHDEVTRVPKPRAPFGYQPVAADSAAPSARPLPRASNRDVVTISFELDPIDALVTVDGAPIAERSLIVPKSTAPLQIRATAPRRKPISADIVPDRDRSVLLHLVPASGGR